LNIALEDIDVYDPAYWQIQSEPYQNF
jgi:hypothetical protein